MTHTNDDFMSNFFSGFKAIETIEARKEAITDDCIEGKITKEEFIRRMKEIDNV